VTFTIYCDGDGTKEEKEGKEKELDILVNVKYSCWQRLGSGVDLHSLFNQTLQEDERSASRH